MSRTQRDILEVIVGNSYGTRDSDLADAARRWWKISAKRCHELEFIVPRQRWRDEPLAVFRITGSKVTDTGRVEFTVVDADAEDAAAVLAAVQGQGVCNSPLRYASL